MSFCHKCGSPIATGDTFCSECGTAVLSTARTQSRNASPEYPSQQQPNPAPQYVAQTAYTLQHKPVSKTNSLGLVALILVGAALVLNIVGTILSYNNYPSDMRGEVIFRAILGLLVPFALSAFVPLMTHILVKTGSSKAAKSLMAIVLGMLVIQVASAVFCVIQYSSMINGNAEVTPLSSFIASINGAELIRIPYQLIILSSRGGRISQPLIYMFFLLGADILYILKNVLALVGLKKVSKT